MPLQVVTDAKTLTLFSQEIGILWKIAQNNMFDATTSDMRQFHKEECMMYADLCLAIVNEAELLAR